MPEPGESGRRAQVSEADRIPDLEAGLVRSALPAGGGEQLRRFMWNINRNSQGYFLVLGQAP